MVNCSKNTSSSQIWNRKPNQLFPNNCTLEGIRWNYSESVTCPNERVLEKRKVIGVNNLYYRKLLAPGGGPRREPSAQLHRRITRCLREQYFNDNAKTRPAPNIFSRTHRNQPEFNVNDTLNGCAMHQVNFLSYRIPKLYPRTLLYSRTGLNNVRASKSSLYFASHNLRCNGSRSNISRGCVPARENSSVKTHWHRFQPVLSLF